MKSFTIVALSFILFDVFLLTLCNKKIAINILNSFLKSEKWTFNHAYKWYDTEIDTSFETKDLLITGSNSENIVHKYNVYDQITVGSQLLTYEYAKIVHWIGVMLTFMNKEWYGDGVDSFETQKERLEIFVLTFEKVKRVLTLFNSALEFMNTIINSHKTEVTNKLIKLLTGFNSISIKPKIREASNNAELQNIFEKLFKLLYTFLTDKSESVLLECCEIENVLEENYLSRLEYEIHEKYGVILMEEPDEKSREEFTFFVFLRETILNSVDEIITIYYTNLGFNYDENYKISNYVFDEN